MPRLIVTKGADEGKTFELTGEVVTIGRDASNTIRLHDTEVSRRHAEFRRLPDGNFQLIDKGSVNGTVVNTDPIQQRVLVSGDHIQIGQHILVYTTSRTETPPASDLADRIRFLAKSQDLELSSAIIKTIGENRGSEILARPESAGTNWLKTRLANLAVMYETIQLVSHILDLDQLLEKIMELIFRSIEADQGCIMLRDTDSGEFQPKAIRTRDGKSDQIAVSRTIMDYVLQHKQGILVSDALHDARFNTGESIAKYNIREAICVPMKGRHETLGVLFLDTISTTRDVMESGNLTGKFGEDHLHLAIAIAHQAALAIEETRYHQAMVQAERLAAVGQTIAAMSHHIKNIMQAVVTGSEFVRMGLAEDDKELLFKGWRLVEKNQQRINDLVKDMLSYSKDREPMIEFIDLNTLVDDVLEVVRGRADEKKIAMEFRKAAALPPVPADPEGIHRALLNIVSNALDAVEDRPDPYVGVQTLLEPDASHVRIVVIDHGVGIPADKIHDIFKPFVSTKGARGTGLGLAVSRKILREHGGDITVQSQPGKGSKFVLRLPMKSPYASDLLNSQRTLTNQPALPSADED